MVTTRPIIPNALKYLDKKSTSKSYFKPTDNIQIKTPVPPKTIITNPSKFYAQALKEKKPNLPLKIPLHPCLTNVLLNSHQFFKLLLA